MDIAIICITIDYIVLSLIIGGLDLLCLYGQDLNFNSIPQGDIGYHEDRKSILGFHNIIFFPSLFLIFLFTRKK
jgi:hypothetical protein